MRSRVAAARQLGLIGLARRLSWRTSQLLRITVSAVRPRYARADFVERAAQKLDAMPIRTFLPCFESLREESRPDGYFSGEEKLLLRSALDELLQDQVSLRGVGRLKLNLTAGNWYDYEPEAALMVNRHDFLVTLVRADVLFADDASREKISQLFRYWIASFDARNLRKYDTPIDAAIRLINWAWVFNSRILEFEDRELRQLSAIIAEQLEYIWVWRSAGGNHLVLEALSHYIFGVMFDQTDVGKRCKIWSRKCLLQELMRQTTTEGVHTEQSMFYHQAVATHYLKFVLASEQAGDELPEQHVVRFRKMLRYVHDTTTPNHSHPVLGDGEPLVTQDREHWEAAALIAAGSLLFDDPVFVDFKPMIGDSTLWFFGHRGAELRVSSSAPASFVYEDAGLICFRDSDNYVFLDAAPFSDIEFPHHGHADALSVELCVGQSEILIDPGGYGYYDDEFRRFFRSTAAHNTIEIDGRSQSDLYGVLGYGRLAKSRILGYTLNDDFDYVAATHDGYRPVQHRREVILLKRPEKALVIVDHLESPRRCNAVSRLHTSPGGHFDLDQQRVVMPGSNGSAAFAYSVAASGDVHSQVVKGRHDDRLQGWVSPETGKVVAAEVLELGVTVSSSATVVIAICLRADETVSAYLSERERVELQVGSKRIVLSEVCNLAGP